jgi:hypothetical protein
MKELFLVKNKFSINPLDEDSQEIFGNFEYGTIFRCDHWKERAIWQHRKLFLLAQIVTHNNPKWPDPYHFIKTMQMDIKSVSIERRLNGEVVEIPKSLKFKSMGEVEFRKLFSDCVNLMLANLYFLLPGMPESEFNRQVEHILELS